MLNMNRSRSAMTLLEVLVVAGVVILLIVILLPSISHGYPSSKRIQCASHLRMVGQSLAIYTMDFEYFPPQLATPAGGAERFNEPTGQKPNIYATLDTLPGKPADLRKWLFCPAAQQWTSSPGLLPASNRRVALP
jgi:type II secretory pathway pseudopilin PulG